MSRLDPLEPRLLFSTWFVAAGAGPGGNGTPSAPFGSIRAAAKAARAGDTVLIRAGTYRESVRPARSGAAGRPITFAPAGDGAVTISGVAPGRDPAAFLAHPAPSRAVSLIARHGVATLDDPSLSGGYTGATIHIAPGQGWVWQAGRVVASSAGRLTFRYAPLHPSLRPSYETPAAGNPYYLTRGVVPARPAAFDLRGRSGVVVRGLSLFGATVITDRRSSDILIDRVDARYVSTFAGEANPWGRTARNRSGIVLLGRNDVIRDSTIAWSSGSGVYLGGAGDSVSNCVIHDVDLDGGDNAAVVARGPGQTISGNTVYNCDRDGIKVSGAIRARVTGNGLAVAMHGDLAGTVLSANLP